MLLNKKRRRYRIPTSFVVIVFVILVGMGIGYAALGDSLEIEGTSGIDSASWDVHFGDVHVESGSVDAVAPTITDDTSLAFSVNLSDPGDYYDFTVDIVNEGTLDAYLDALTISPTLTPEQEQFFTYVVEYEDGTTPDIGDALDGSSTKSLHIRFEYVDNGDANLYPTDDINFEFSVDMTYVQGTL